MEQTIYKCEECGKTTEDYYNEIGWILFEPTAITVTRGRKKDRTADTGYLKNNNKTLHFCGLTCFTKLIKRLSTKRAKVSA